MTTPRKRVNVGDHVKVAYIDDANPQNNVVGEVVHEYVYNYYPNGDPLEPVERQGCTIRYPDGSELKIDDTQRNGSGIISPLTIVT